MTKEKKVKRAFFWLRRREDIAREVDAELKLHIELTIEELLAKGMDEASAREEAERRFGDFDARHRECTEFGARRLKSQRRIEIMAEMIQDLRFAIRSFAKTPVFSLIVILTLAFGIGASTLIFSVADGVLLRPLPYQNPEGLVMLGEKFTDRGRRGPSGNADELGPISPMNFFDWQRRSASFEAIAAQDGTTLNLTGEGEPERLPAAGVSAEYFSLLRALPVLGRGISKEEDEPGRYQVAVLSYGLWQRRWGGDPGIIGRKITLNEEPFAVIGVMPPGFRPPEALFQKEVDIWVPLAFFGDNLSTRRGRFLQAIGRLQTGVSLSQAREEMDALAASLAQEYPRENTGAGIRVEPLLKQTVGDIGRPLMMLLGAVALLLLIACANVANLFLARAAARQREIAVRSALGAGRGRIIRQLLTESVFVAVLGGGLGVGLAFAGVKALSAINPGDIPRMEEVSVDLRVLSFALALSVATGILFGLMPAIQASRTDVSAALKSGASSVSSSRGGNRLRYFLVVTEMALSVILLIGAGLFINSFVRLQQVYPGFDSDNLLTMNVSLGPQYDSREKQLAFFNDLIKRLENISGARSAGTVTSLPLSGDLWLSRFSFEGRANDSDNLPHIPWNVVSPGYFKTLGMRFAEGRDFTAQDDRNRDPVFIVNESFARKYWPGEAPVGQRLKFGEDSRSPWATVVGVVNDIRQEGLSRQGYPEIYLPSPYFVRSQANVVVKSESDPALISNAARQAVWEIDPNLAITLSTMKAQVSDSITEPRFYTLLLGSFAVTALILACVGIYGVMSYMVSGRRREIGIRRALGAQETSILWMILRRGMALTATGLALGLTAAFWTTELLATLLFDVSVTDPLTFALVALVLGAVATAACYLPARRALQIDPINVLRAE